MTRCAACHGMAHVSVFSGKIVSEVNVVVRTDNQSVPKIHIWLSVTNFWLSWTTGQPLLRTLLIYIEIQKTHKIFILHHYND